MGNHTKSVLVPLSVSNKIYEDRWNKAFGKSKGRKKKTCDTCGVLVLDKKNLPSQCKKDNCWTEKLEIGSIMSDDINVGESS